MPLSCYCNDDGDWFHEPPDDYSTLDTKRCRKCASCRERIPVGATVLKMRCWRYYKDEIEHRIHGYRDDVQIEMPHRYLCERCGDLYLSLTELGFCLNLGEDMRELVQDYAQMRREASARSALKAEP